MGNAVERIGIWGIQCRTCHEGIVLGTKADLRFADFFSFLQPASFRCVHGHTHRYDSDDVFFFPSTNKTPADVAEILQNRANYLLLDSPEISAPVRLSATQK